MFINMKGHCDRCNKNSNNNIIDINVYFMCCLLGEYADFLTHQRADDRCVALANDT